MKNHVMCLVLVAVGAGVAFYAGKHCKSGACHKSISHQRCSLRTNMRKLWSDHVWWTRMYIIAALDKSADLKAATDRLMQNQDDIGAVVASVYGAAAGSALTALLKEHILIAADVVAAAQAGDSAKLQASNEKWYQNADEIAAFLSGANPAWGKAAMEQMMHEHLKLTTDEVVARLHQDWDGDIAAFEKVFHEIMMMSDDLTSGIVQQFPNKF